MSTTESDATFNEASGTDASNREALTSDFKQLFDSVEDLLKRVADIESAELQKIRAKARVALMVAKSAIQDAAAQARRQVLQAAATTDGYVRDYPWQSIGVAALAGVAVGVLIARRD